MKADVITSTGPQPGLLDLDGRLFGQEPARRQPARVVRAGVTRRKLARTSENPSEVNYFTKEGSNRRRHRRRTPRRRALARFPRGGILQGPNPSSHAHDLNQESSARSVFANALSAKPERRGEPCDHRWGHIFG